MHSSSVYNWIRSIDRFPFDFQTDFDDGHCPSWGNQLYGLYNVYKAVYNMLPGKCTINCMDCTMQITWSNIKLYVKWAVSRVIADGRL